MTVRKKSGRCKEVAIVERWPLWGGDRCGEVKWSEVKWIGGHCGEVAVTARWPL